MADIFVTSRFNVGDKAIIVNDSSSRAYYNIVKIIKIKSIAPDVDEAGNDIITYTVEVYAPNSVNKVQLDVVESQLLTLQDFEDTFNTF